ncbi:MAG: phage terminase large subunit [Gemmatimonadetes bacterium]|nr:phage terminase large subunit [Gemmatimonadota bacterium]
MTTLTKTPPTSQELDSPPPPGAFHQPRWAHALLERNKWRYKVPYGGRGSAKSWSVGLALVLLGDREPIRVPVCRDRKLSLDQSSKKVLEASIERAGLQSRYNIRDNYISHPNGTFFFFRGLSSVQEREIMGWEDCDIVWIDQAEMMTATAWELLRPTIRKPGSEIWLTFNPRYRYDPVYKYFVANEQPDAFTKLINYTDNPWFELSPMERERQADLRDQPDRYAHIWLGRPDDEGAERKVLPYALMDLCVKAWEKYDIRPHDMKGVIFGGLDVADTGAAKNALGLRRGPCLFRLDRWSENTLGRTARRMDGAMRELGGTRLYYDVGGVGAGIRSHLIEMKPSPTYGIRPENFGGAVKGPKVLYTRGQTNEQFFQRRNAQLGWGMRLRANLTQRLMEGDDVDMNKCLFISPELERREEALAEFDQPIWEEDTSGRMKIDKTPDDAPSPDAYDGAILSFAYDSEGGLTRPT